MAKLSTKNQDLKYVPLPQSPAPAGLIQSHGGSVAPAGWLECDGTAISRTTYSALFAVISTTYGVGDGSTTFNVPSGPQRTKTTDLDVSSATGGWSEVSSKGYAFSDSDDNWFLHFEINGSVSSTSSVAVSIEGITFPSGVNSYMTGSAFTTSSDGYRLFSSLGGNTLNLQTNSATIVFIVNGTVRLAGKPTDAFVGADSNFSTFADALEGISIIKAYPDTAGVAVTNGSSGAAGGAPDWLNSTVYEQFQLITFNSIMYRALTTHTSPGGGTFLDDIANWETAGSASNGVIVTAWQDYTPTSAQGLGTPTYRLQWRQNGENIDVVGDMDVAATGSAEARVELPNSYTIDFKNTVSEVNVGFWERATGSPSAVSIRYPILATHGDTFFNVGRDVSSATNDPLTPADGDEIILGGQRASVRFSVPVAKFANAGVVASIQDLTRKTKEVDLSFSSTPAGWSLIHGSGYAYSDSKGQWRLKFNFAATMTANSDASVTIDGIKWKNVSGFLPPLTFLGQNSNSTGRCFPTVNTGTLTQNVNSGFTVFYISGDLELDSQPTDAFVGASSFSTFTDSLENAVSVAAYIPTSDDATAIEQNVIVRYQTAIVTLDVGFTGGERDVKVTRIGDVVTITGKGLATHSSATSRASSSGLIPDWARPLTSTTRNSYYSESTFYADVRIKIDGQLTTGYSTSNNNTAAPINITYTII